MKSSELYRILLADGWYVLRQGGSHATMAHATKKAKNRSGRLTVPRHGSKEVPGGTCKDILKDAGLR